MFHVHFKHGEAAGVHSKKSLLLAIEHACDLIDSGAEVSGIEGEGGLGGLNAEMIKLKCAERKARTPK
jgi:hypothetical protein